MALTRMGAFVEHSHLLALVQVEDGKLLAALLAGVRRAFPFVSPEEAGSVVDKHAPDLFRLMHTAGFGVAVQALSLLFQLLDARSMISDRFYRQGFMNGAV